MNQSRLGSFIEAWVNVFVGFGIGLCVNAVALPAVGIAISVNQNLSLAAIMTVVSIARSYLLRRVFNQLRLFNHGREKGIERVEGEDE